MTDMATGDSAQEPALVPGFVARGAEDDNDLSVLADCIEVRRIVVAQGIDFHNDCVLGHRGTRLPQELCVKPSSVARHQSPPMDLRPLEGYFIHPDGTAECYNAKQGVRYELSFVIDKDAFRQALMTPGIMVIYNGHARYGRGPCFSDPALHVTETMPEFDLTLQRCPRPSENWGDGSDPQLWGQFKWGYPYINIPVIEILHYGYRAAAVPGSDDLKSPAKRPDRHPDINLQHLHVRRLEELVLQVMSVRDDLLLRAPEDPHERRDMPEELRWLYTLDPNDLRSYLDDAAGEGFWTQDAYQSYRGKSYLLPDVILAAGWCDTSVSPSDLGDTDLLCRCICHFGCSTFKHNQKILRKPEYLGWRREGNERYAYFTTNVAECIAANFFLYNLLSYAKPSAYLSWEPLLRWTVEKTNVDLLRAGRSFEII